MTETQQGAGFDPGRLRTVTRMRRSRDDRMVAGVCGGFARYLDIDPVVVRVVLAALTVISGAGLILYVAAWLLVPEEGSETSIVGRRLPSGRNEREVRTVGFAIAGVLAVLAVASSGPWSRWWAYPWPLVALAFLVWFVLRPARPPGTGEGPPEVAEPAAAGAAPTGATVPARARPRRGDGSLAWLTIGVGLIAAGIVWLVDRFAGGVEWPDYVALELAVVGIGTLVGAWRGDGRRLVPLGIVLGPLLLASSQLPALTAGDVRQAPRLATEVEPEYVLGAGQLRLDLTGVADLEALDGRTIWIDNGTGQVRVIVPDDVDLTVAAHVGLGHVVVFTRAVGGWSSDVDWQDTDDADPDLRLVIDQSFGEIQVMRS
jgi:phage shock protein PspC (stress-responsive transcriptional regulator)